MTLSYKNINTKEQEKFIDVGGLPAVRVAIVDGEVSINGDVMVDDVNVSNLPTTVDTNYGTPGASTVRTAAMMGVGSAAVSNGNPVPISDAGGSVTVDSSDLTAIAASASVMDDWDESDRAKVNLIVGQAGVQGNSGSVTATTQRVVLATDVGLPAGTAALGSVASGIRTDKIMNNTTELTPKFAFANITASQTDSNLVTAVTSKKIRVHQVAAVAGGTATNLTFNSKGGGAGTAISPLFANALNSGEILGFSPMGWFETTSGEALTVTTGSGSTTGILIGYTEV